MRDSRTAANQDSDLSTLRAENCDLKDFLDRHGYRRCDIPACNCNSYHGGNAYQRLTEIGDELGDDLQNGQTILQGVKNLRARIRELEAAIRNYQIARTAWETDPAVTSKTPGLARDKLFATLQGEPNEKSER